MAVRTVVTPQNLSAMVGQALTTQSADIANGMQIKNTGSQVVVARLAAGEALTITFASQPDAYTRVGDITKVMTGPSVWFFGPFAPPVNWGDGAAQLFLDFSGSSGNPQIAAITII